MARIVLSGLTKRFAPRAGEKAPERPALDSLDMEVESGELLVLVGPSGCGKSTALRLIAGLEEPSAGSVRIGERDVTRLPPQKRDVAMVFQGYALYPHMTVRDNMAFPLKMRGVNKAERQRKVEQIAQLVGLGGKLGRLPTELSGGERQRVAMGRAIVREPQVFLFDEPLSNLDAKLRAELRVELVSLIKRLGTTALYVTHDQAEAMTMGDRVAVLNHGRLQQLDVPRAVYQRPANTFVATFVGSPEMNLLALSEAGEPEIGALDGSVAVPAAARRVGFRPEHTRLSPDAAGLRLQATVRAHELLGAETIVYLQAEEARLSMRLSGFGGPAQFEEVRVGVAAEHLRWFDEDGAALNAEEAS